MTEVIAGAAAGIRHVFVRDLEVRAVIGVHPHEQTAPQRVRVSVDLAVAEEAGPAPDELAAVVDYEAVTNRLRAVLAGPPANLVETLAERLAAVCLEDGRVRAVRVRVEKPDALPDVAAVGVEIERRRPSR